MGENAFDPRGRGSGNTDKSVQQIRLDLYKLAYEEGKREVDNQIAQLDSMRQRSVQFLAFVGSASAFLVGTSLNAPVRTFWFYFIATIASLLMLSSVYLCTSLLRGRRRVSGQAQERWKFRLTAKNLIGWVEADVRPSGPQFYRALAEKYSDMAKFNEDGLERVRRSYRFFLGVTFMQLILWLLLAWLYG